MENQRELVPFINEVEMEGAERPPRKGIVRDGMARDGITKGGIVKEREKNMQILLQYRVVARTGMEI